MFQVADHTIPPGNREVISPGFLSTTANETAATIRQWIRTLLENENWGGPQLGLVTEAGVAVWESSRGEFATLGVQGIRDRLLAGMQAMYVNMSEAVDGVLGRLTGAGAAGVTRDLAEQIAERLAGLENVDNAAIRSVMQEMLPGQTISEDFVLSIRRSLLGTTQPVPWRAVDAGALPDRRLVERAITLRLRQGLLNRAGMERNVAVAKVRVDGVETFIEAVNTGGGGAHSEELLAAEIARLRAEGKIVDVLELFTERDPCLRSGGCRAMIDQQMPGVRVFFFTRETGLDAQRALWGIYSR